MGISLSYYTLWWYVLNTYFFSSVRKIFISCKKIFSPFFFSYFLFGRIFIILFFHQNIFKCISGKSENLVLFFFMSQWIIAYSRFLCNFVRVFLFFFLYFFNLWIAFSVWENIYDLITTILRIRIEKFVFIIL